MTPARGPALGIDLGGTKIEALLLAPDGRALWRQRLATPAGDYGGTLQAINQLARAARQQADAELGADVSADVGAEMSIGVGSPGTATASGLMKNCNSTCLNGRPLQRDLEQLLGQPVALANDANCLALSEATDGAGAGADVVFAAILGTGAGAGIAVHGRVLKGANGLAGEWGHNPLPWTPWADADDASAPRCHCGQRGCVETYVSGSGLAADHLRNTGQPRSGEDICSAAAAGDAAAAATLERHAQRLARALAGVINLLDPDVIVLGGGLSHMAHLYQRVPALWARWVFSGGAAGEPVRTRLLPAVHGDASGVRGAAWLGRTAAQAGPRWR